MASLASSSLRRGRFIFMWAPSSWCCLPLLGLWDPSDLSDLDNIKEAADNELWSLSNPWSREGEGNRGDGGLWSLQYLLHSWPLEGWQGDGWQSEPPSSDASFRGNLLGDKTGKIVRPADSHGYVLAPSLLLSDLLQLEQWPLYPLGLSWDQQQGRPIFQPTYLLLWVGMQHPYPHLQSNPLPLNISHRKELPYLGLSPLLWVSPVLASCSISSTMGAIQEWGGGGTAPNSSVKVICISKQCLKLGQLDGGLLARDQISEWEGELSNASSSHRSFATLG